MDLRRTSVREKKKPDFFGSNRAQSHPSGLPKPPLVDKLLKTREDYNNSFVMGGIERSPQNKKLAPTSCNEGDDIPPYSNHGGHHKPDENGDSEGRGDGSTTLVPNITLNGTTHSEDNPGIMTPMDTTTPITNPHDNNPTNQNQESEEARNVRMREERARKVQVLKENRQKFIIHGAEDTLSQDSGDDTQDGAEAPVDNAIIAGKMLNLMDLQQKHQYANAFHINRIESNQNQYILRITGHDIQDTNDTATLHSWWEWLLGELDAPTKIRRMETNTIHFSTNIIENRGRNHVSQGTSKVLILEFPTKEVPKWILNHGVLNCRKVQSLRGLEKLSFSPMLTASELKVQQYAQSVLNKLKANFNGPPAVRKSYLANIVSIRPIGRIKQHIATVDTGGHKRNIHYNKLLTDELTRDFLPMESGEIALPPPDYTYQPNDHSLLEVDFKAEARGMGVSLQGRSEGINLRVPNYIQPSIRKMLTEDDRESSARAGYASGVNTEQLGAKRFKQDRFYNNSSGGAGSSYSNKGGYNGTRNNDTRSFNGNFSNDRMKVGWNSSRGNDESEGRRLETQAQQYAKAKSNSSERGRRSEHYSSRDRASSSKHLSKDRDESKKSMRKSSRHSKKSRDESVDAGTSRRGSVVSTHISSRRPSIDQTKDTGTKEYDEKYQDNKRKDGKKKKHRRRSAKKSHKKKKSGGRRHYSSSEDSSSDSSSSDSSSD